MTENMRRPLTTKIQLYHARYLVNQGFDFTLTALKRLTELGLFRNYDLRDCLIQQTKQIGRRLTLTHTDKTSFYLRLSALICGLGFSVKSYSPRVAHPRSNNSQKKRPPQWAHNVEVMLTVTRLPRDCV